MVLIEIPKMHLRVERTSEPWEGEGALWLLNPVDEADATRWIKRAGAFTRSLGQGYDWVGVGAFPYRVSDVFDGRDAAPADLLVWGQAYPVSIVARGESRPPAILGQMQLGVSMLGDAVGQQVVGFHGVGEPPPQLIQGGTSFPTSFPGEEYEAPEADDPRSEDQPDSPADIVSRTDSVSIRLASIAVVERIALEMLDAEREDPWIRGTATGLLHDMELLRKFVAPGTREEGVRAALDRLTQVYVTMNPLLQKGVDYGLLAALRSVLLAFGIDIP